MNAVQVNSVTIKDSGSNGYVDVVVDNLHVNGGRHIMEIHLRDLRDLGEAVNSFLLAVDYKDMIGG